MKSFPRGQARRGFTLVEIMVVVVIIGLLAALAIPAFQRVRQKARLSRMANDLRTYSQAFEQYAAQNGTFPPTGTLATEPAGMEGQLRGWSAPTPLGGHYTWDNWGSVKKICIFDALDHINELVELDAMIDDGNAATGNFKLYNAQYSLVLEGN